MTEIYEYAKSLRGDKLSIPHLQMCKVSTSSMFSICAGIYLYTVYVQVYTSIQFMYFQIYYANVGIVRLCQSKCTHVCYYGTCYFFVFDFEYYWIQYHLHLNHTSTSMFCCPIFTLFISENSPCDNLPYSMILMSYYIMLVLWC